MTTGGKLLTFKWHEGTEAGMIVYTDGSYRKERAAGTYAWIAGWHDETGNLGVLMHGGGKECDGDNPARGRINSTRMETLAMIRARQIVRQYWDSHVMHHMDNQSAIARDQHARRETPRQRWRAPDSDIWNMANNQRPDHAWTTRWVKAHADDDKREHELTNEERNTRNWCNNEKNLSKKFTRRSATR